MDRNPEPSIANLKSRCSVTTKLHGDARLLG
jgi:hypothetical protein